MIYVELSDTISNACPELIIATIECRVSNSAFSEGLWTEISAAEKRLKDTLSIDEIKNRKNIAATRAAYKATGKDPNRYRPSAEALCRRITHGLELYKINTLVDVINLVSIETGYSIGGFDADKINGTHLLLDVGRGDDVFEGIGRGPLNIDGLPVYRDTIGGIGTPTSDEERTKLSVETTHLLMIINGYSGDKEDLVKSMNFSVESLEKYAAADDFTIHVISKDSDKISSC
ncbi:MAG: phenylalanine--tRNA ligase beta subunit-related protein [Bacteroidales bacterium]|nr:phenylalanine--tRNA ligase beta subunit-related protein [Bacteroidales bacterium]